MSSLEETIIKAVKDFEASGEPEELITSAFRNSYKRAIDSVFSYGKVHDAIKEKLEEYFVPYIETYDFSKQTVKLDEVLTEIVNKGAIGESQEILRNFRDVMTFDRDRNEILLSEVFDAYKKWIAADVDCSGRTVDTDDRPTYEPIRVISKGERESRDWSDYEKAVITFSIDEDDEAYEEQGDDFKRSFILSRWKEYDKEDHYTLREIAGKDVWNDEINITSLRGLSSFDLFLLQIRQAHIKIVTDIVGDEDDVEPEEEPEVSFA